MVLAWLIRNDAKVTFQKVKLDFTGKTVEDLSKEMVDICSVDTLGNVRA